MTDSGSSSFPRGKESNKPASSTKTSSKFSSRDTLFGNTSRVIVDQASSKKKKNGKQQNQIDSDSLLPSIGLGLAQAASKKKETIHIEPLNATKFTPGTFALGFVLTVTNDSAVISLPGGNLGHLDLSEVSDVIHQKIENDQRKDVPYLSLLLKPFQPLRVAVLQAVERGEKRVMVTARSSIVNRGLALKHLYKGMSLDGCVVSKEDHGYLMNCGVSSVNFFLSHKEIAKNSPELLIGQPISTVIRSINEAARTVSLGVVSSLGGEPDLPVQNAHLPFQALSPGMLFNVTANLGENGLVLNYLNLFHGVADMNSLGQCYSNDEWKEAYRHQNVMLARIVYLDQVNKVVRLSLKPHILEYRVPLVLPKLGDIVESLEVVFALNKHGATLRRTGEDSAEDAMDVEEKTELTSKQRAAKKANKRHAELIAQEKATTTFVIPKKSLAAEVEPSNDDEEADNDDEEAQSQEIGESLIEKVYTSGTSIPRVKITGYHLVEGLVVATNLRRLMESAISHPTDVKAGQAHVVEVTSIRDFGLTVKLAGKISAVCPVLHTTEAQTSTMETQSAVLKKKFKIGQKIKVRVWEAEGSSIIVTAKKRLVDASSEKVITSYDEIKVGSRLLGVVSKMNRDGLMVRFFNKLTGELSAAVLTKQGIPDFEQSYRVGQVVEVVVLKRQVSMARGKSSSFVTLTLGLDMNLSEKALSSLIASVSGVVENDDGEKAMAGLVSGVVIKEETEFLTVRLDDGRTGRLYKTQAFDFASTADVVFAKENKDGCPFTIGTRIEQALVISESTQFVNLSLKPLLLTAYASSMTAADSSNADVELSFPASIEEVSVGQVIAGYVYKAETYGVLVRFRNGFAGLAPRPAVADGFVKDAADFFHEGDSVRAVVTKIDHLKGRVLLSLKASQVPASVQTVAPFVTASLKELYEAAAATATTDEKMLPDWRRYPIGQTVTATVSSAEEYGLVLVAEDQTTVILVKGVADDKAQKLVGKSVSVRILDIDFSTFVLEGLLVEETKGKKSAPAAEWVVDAEVQAEVVSVHPTYALVTVNGHPGFLQTVDWHTPRIPVDSIVAGAKVKAIVSHGVPESEEGGDFPHANVPLLHLPSTVVARKTSNAAANDGVGGRLRIGAVESYRVESVTANELRVVPVTPLGVPLVKATVDISSSHSDFSAADNLANNLKKAVPASKKGAQKNLSLEEREGLSVAHPFKKLQPGSIVWCSILQVRRDGARDEEKKANNPVSLHLRMISSESKEPTSVSVGPRMLQATGRDEIQAPSIVTAVVSKITPTGVVVALSPYLSADLLWADVSSDESLARGFSEKAYVGLRVVVLITSIVRDNGRLTRINVSRVCLESHLKSSSSIGSLDANKIFSDIPALEEGALTLGVLNLQKSGARRRGQQASELFFSVELPGRRTGQLAATEIADQNEWSDLVETLSSRESLPNGMKHGSLISVRVLSVDENGKVAVSVRPSRISNNTNWKVTTRADPMPAEGQVVSAYVTSTSAKGCFLLLSNRISGRCMLKDLSDEFVSNPSEAFPAGRLVQGRVTGVDHLAGQVTLNLKPSVVVGDVQAMQDCRTLSVGQIIRGTVQRVTEIGVFVALDNLSVVGLARRAVALQDPTKTLTQEYNVGDVVKARILRVSVNTQKVALGLTENFFKSDFEVVAMSEDEDEEENSEEEDSDDEDFAAMAAGVSSDEEDGDEDDEELEVVSDDEADAMALDSDEDEEEDGSEEDEEDESEDEAVVTKKRRVAADELGDLAWDDETPISTAQSTAFASNDSDDSDDSETADDKTSARQRARQRDADRRRTEQELRARERALAEGRLVPESADDFERLLLATPNSSYLWVQYMAWHVGRADIDAARLIANRALRTILYREEEEKLNVWQSLVALEYKYGSKDSLERVFAQATNEARPKPLFLELARVYEAASDKEGAVALFEKAMRRPGLKKSKKVWAAYHALLVRIGDVKRVKEQLARSLQSLSKHKHVEVISRMAISEFEFGSPDRGRVLFEELLAAYPKRSDLWHMYVDREVKSGNVVEARQLYERMVATRGNARHMKAVFKKFLAFEAEFGTEERQDAVKQMARDYVASLA